MNKTARDGTLFLGYRSSDYSSDDFDVRLIEKDSIFILILIRSNYSRCNRRWNRFVIIMLMQVRFYYPKKKYQFFGMEYIYFKSVNNPRLNFNANKHVSETAN